MAWVSGVFSRIHNWVSDRDALIKILATRHDAEDDNLAGGINQTLNKAGQNTPTANLPMGNFRHTGVAVAQARNDYVAVSQLQDSALTFSIDTGAADAYVIAPIVAITSYVGGNLFWFKAANNNTGASTIDISTVGAKSIFKHVDIELDADDIQAGGIYGVFYETTADAFQLISPITATSVNRNHISFIISNGTDTDHDIDLAVGEAADSTNDQLMKTGSVIVKQIDADWVAGSAAGGFPSGLALTADTWYHHFVIKDVTGGTVDAGFDSSLTATNLLTDASDYTLFRRVGSVLTDSSSNILAFTQLADYFLWADPPLDVNVTEDTTANLRVLSVPSDLKSLAHINVHASLNLTTNTNVYISSPDVNDEAASTTAAPLGSTGVSDGVSSTHGSVGNVQVFTDTSSQVRTIAQAASTTLRIATLGWLDFRGKE